MNKETLKQLEKLLPLVNGEQYYLKTSEFSAAFKALMSAIKTLRIENDLTYAKAEKEIHLLVADILEKHKNLESKTEESKKESRDVSTKFSKYLDEFKKELSDFKKGIRSGEDGYTPEVGVDYFTNKDKKKFTKEIIKELKEEIPDNLDVHDIIEEINNLPLTDENKIDASHIKNLPKAGTIGGRRFPDAPRDGYIYARRDGLWYQITPGGSGSSVETPLGTVNGSNTSFTVSNEPAWIVVDGITYFAGAGYSYSVGTLTIDTPPVSFIRSIY